MKIDSELKNKNIHFYNYYNNYIKLKNYIYH